MLNCQLCQIVAEKITANILEDEIKRRYKNEQETSCFNDT